ncbi:hypothetical protein ACWOFR_06395 [Carnobacterium gallinarum]|uniref:hypothetical protein n=1 Tax=Carnobacterium gallinarum TaxID=2749 RepID=UPI00054E49D6|nr:hypothetical protein [Carnobacterium gallinarum]
MYKLVTDNEEMQKLINGYFILIRNNLEMAMEKFANRECFGIESMSILFKEDLDEYEDQKELQEIKKNQVVLLAESPAVQEDEKIYLSFKELYSCLERVVYEKYLADENSRKLFLVVRRQLCN